MLRKKRSNIALFIPHNGCPHTCSFCNQVSISGKTRSVAPSDIRNACISAVAHGKIIEKETELAFFGGSFTAIPRDYLLEILQAGQECVNEFGLKGIRCSTRPDAIDEEVLEILKKHGVTAIELGVQSMDEEVLSANERGHSGEDAIKAAKQIKEMGFSLGVQMMTGLYKDTPEKSLETARKLILMEPDTVRIYPTVILKNTKLAEVFLSGEYRSFGFEETVELCSEIYELFHEENIEIIRLGLHSERSMEKDIIGGIYHPALGEICQSRIYFNKIKSKLKFTGDYIIYISHGEVSKVIGHKKENITKFQKLGLMLKIEEKQGLKPFEIETKIV